MGLGKTIQAIGYLQLHPELRPALIVVPAAVKINWKREIERWMSTPETVRILSGQTPDTLGSGMLSSPTIYICNYDILTYWEDHLKSVQPQVMIVDEGHYCKNPKALRTRSVQSLAKQINKLIILTGTPIINRPNELFPLLQMIDPKSWPNFFRYALQYCDAHSNGFGWDFSGASNLEELHQVTRPYIVRRTKSQVLKELPPKRRAVINIEFDARIWDEYSNYVLEAAHSAGPAEALVWIEKSKQAAAKGKLPAAMNWIEDFLGTGEKLVVFCTHNLTVDALMGKFGSQAVKVTGDVTGQARQDAVDRFQNDPQVRLFVGNIKAAGIGITLTAASDVAFLEFGWTPEEMDQAEDRLHRIGQIDSVTCWYICADGTIDNDIVELLESKRVAVDIVTDGKVGDMQFSIERELWERVLVNHAE
jgi:SWI/SNF-related matrix-associated actin-dependent regulator 1 of chromatin subfamily A